MVPSLIPPMLATAGQLPPARDDELWSYEMKWDGARAVVYVQNGTARAMSRNSRDITLGYPELATLPGSLGDLHGGGAVLDGELVAFDSAGAPSFALLQSRMHVRAAEQVRQLARTTPVVFVAFDVLHLAGTSTIALPYDERRAILTSLNLDSPQCLVPPAFTSDGAAALATSRLQRLEGVVAKRRDSAYVPGARSESWLKVKHMRMQEVVIGGWKPGSGRRGGGIGSLLLGVYDGDDLVYSGHVGTGFSQAALRALAESLQPLVRDSQPYAVPPPREHARDAVWVQPRLVGEVTFTDWTRDGRLRHPSWRGLRPDKDPRDVHVEPEPTG